MGDVRTSSRPGVTAGEGPLPGVDVVGVMNQGADGTAWQGAGTRKNSA